MSEMPLISVAMCTYNGERYLREQIESILHQTHTNLELVIVDDGSTDRTFELAQTYAQQDKRVRCIKNEHNLGFNRNFEKALSLTTGEYIAISDQDDIWELNKLELLLAHIGDNWLVFSNSVNMSPEGERLPTLLLDGFNFEKSNYRGMLLQNWVTGHTTLFKRELLAYILPFPQKGYYDWWMGFIAFYHHKITYLNKALTHYRVHAASVIQQEQQKNAAQMNKHNLAVILDMMVEMEHYKNLKPEDRTFIGELKAALMLKQEGRLSVPLLKLVYQHYHSLFNAKNRTGFSLFNFAYKYARGIKVS
ncbi:glycosyltransferase family 2 protein [Mucilaginibacter koreensis]